MHLLKTNNSYIKDHACTYYDFEAVVDAMKGQPNGTEVLIILAQSGMEVIHLQMRDGRLHKRLCRLEVIEVSDWTELTCEDY